MSPRILPSLNRRLVFIHATFWISYLTLMVFGFSSRMEYESALLRALLLLIPQITVAYLNAEILVPKFLITKNYIEFIFYLVLLLVATYFLLDFISNSFLLPDDMIRPRGRFRDFEPPPGRRPFNPSRGLTFLSFLVTVAILLLSTAYKTAQMAFRREREASELRTEKLDAELKFLKSQINPHFLFNALNNVYTLTTLKSEAAPGMILKLSEILRYLLYDCNQEKVPLAKELAYIKNYIELQKLKDTDAQNIEVDFAEVDHKLMIAPMLFIPYIENSFKHSQFEDLEKGWIRMNLTVDGHQLVFQINNSLPETSFTKDKQTGIGLDNVKRRLELLYPGRHELSVSPGETEFSVILKILV